jgi:molybdopterin converting factor small subunit
MKKANARVITKVPFAEFGTNRRRTRRTALSMTVRVLAFARLREILGAPESVLELPAGARIGDAWAALARQRRALESERSSTRAARNGCIVPFDAALSEGDEVAFLPPVGGG